jgi:subtilisin family serine protease
VVLVAAGNEGYDRVNFLGTHPNLICVGASTSRDMQASYSNIGTHLSVVAPGGPQPIIAANASWGDQRHDNYILHEAGFTQYTYFEGTSAATPIAAGVCALILSANPNLTAAQVKEILQKSADKVGYPSEYTSGHSVRYGYGRVNALRAVKLAKSTVGAGSVDTSSPNPPVTPPKPIPVVNPPQPPPNSDQRAIVNSPDGLLNVRARPDSSAPLVKTLKNGAVVSVKGVSEDGKWCRIDIGQFVARRFLKF